MWMSILACIFLALPGTQALGREQCTRSDLTPEEEKIVLLYCNRVNVGSNKLVFGDPSDRTKFYVCTDVSSGCTGTCPNGGVYDQIKSDCGSAAITCPLPTGADPNVPLIPLDSFVQNPCPKIGAETCFKFGHTLKNKFILCESSTTSTPKVGQCLDSFQFNVNRQICERIDDHIITCGDGKNPCKPIPESQKIINANLLYYGCADDPTKFIQCDKWGHMTVKQCKNKTVWCQKDLACVSQ